MLNLSEDGGRGLAETGGFVFGYVYFIISLTYLSRGCGIYNSRVSRFVLSLPYKT